MRKINFFNYLAAAAIITILSAFIYASVQQSYRSAANDPQLEIATDIHDRLANGETIDKWLARDTVEISKSSSVFIALYDDKRRPIRSTGLLDGQLPALPRGTYEHALKNGEDVFTWQPRRGVRMAIVLKALSNVNYPFVAVGRSLSEIEKREENLLGTAVISWLLCIGVLMLHWIVSFLRHPGDTNE